MFKALFGQNVNAKLAHALYGAVVARARDQGFYTQYGVPDTFDGRFEMLVMHLFLLHTRLKEEDQNTRNVSQQVFDAFIDDMDSALREAAVGDQTVPKRIAKMTQVFYGRTGAYETALASEDRLSELADVIARNLFPDIDPPGHEKALAVYMNWQVEQLENSTAYAIVNEQVPFQGPLLEEAEYAV